MNDRTDQQLLRDYATDQSEAAFSEIARRHVDLVYSAALRMVRDAHTAGDVTQGVFLALARNARQLADRPILSGWLHCTTRNLAAKAVRSDVRRRAHEQEAAMNQLSAAEPDLLWEHVAPHLDEALGEMTDADREALLLRYFEGKSAREMATILGTTEDAAQKRVSRAVERLRELFGKRGVTVGTGALVVAVTANAVQAAPAAVLTSISTGLVGTTIATSATATKTIAMTALQKTLVTATIAVVTSMAIYEARQASTLRTDAQTLRQQQDSLNSQFDSLQRDRASLSNRLSLLAHENMSLKSNVSELLKLRSEVGALRNENQSLKLVQSTSTDEAKSPALSKGFGTLGDYLPTDKLSDDGIATAEGLVKSTLWAIREGKITRLEELDGPFSGQSEPGDVVGQISQSEAGAFKMFQGALSNAAGFHLSSRMRADGQQYEVRFDAEPSADHPNDSFLRNFHFSFVLDHQTNGWRFGSQFTESTAK